MKLVGVIGQKNAGKSTIASILVEQFGYQEFAFADPLKQIIEILFCLDCSYVNDQQLKEQMIEELRVSPRRLMQQIGTDLFREKLEQVLPELELQGYTLWIWNMKKRIENYCKTMESLGKEVKIVISDIRFEDEQNFVNLIDGSILIEVIRTSNSQTDTNNQIDHHKSEHLSIKTGSMTKNIITNDGSLEELEEKVQTIIINKF